MALYKCSVYKNLNLSKKKKKTKVTLINGMVYHIHGFKGQLSKDANCPPPLPLQKKRRRKETNAQAASQTNCKESRISGEVLTVTFCATVLGTVVD